MFGELAIAPRADPHQADERAPHHVDAAEPRGRGHVLQAVIGALEQAPSRLYPQLKHVLGRRGADFPGEDPLEISNAHRHAIREIVD